ncbi:MAG TPA: ABC transporter ATP-binding protein [Polyangiaceae bacterium]|nr:ABC transporter ATP-binding protein [Polyangiaceae bacterium]
MPKPFVFLENLGKRFPSGRRAQDMVVFQQLSLGIERGEFVSLIGHSGCGKSTILNLVAGLDRASEGYVFVNNRVVSGPGLSRGVVFQNHSLLPWLSALGNVMFSVRARHPDWSKAEIRAHSERYLGLVGLNGAEQRKPAQLSGGMRQRVGIARAFATQPEILLLDEPFGALDALTRGTIQDELLALWQRANQTILMITHDVDEAIYLSDRVLVMSDGPNSRIAEAVSIDLPRPRTRTELLRLPRYHELRAHLLEFLTRGAHAPQRERESVPEPAPISLGPILEPSD